MFHWPNVLLPNLPGLGKGQGHLGSAGESYTHASSIWLGKVLIFFMTWAHREALSQPHQPPVTPEGCDIMRWALILHKALISMWLPMQVAMQVVVRAHSAGARGPRPCLTDDARRGSALLWLAVPLYRGAMGLMPPASCGPVQSNLIWAGISPHSIIRCTLLPLDGKGLRTLSGALM